jgi:hypothetical protein
MESSFGGRLAKNNRLNQHHVNSISMLGLTITRYDMSQRLEIVCESVYNVRGVELNWLGTAVQSCLDGLDSLVKLVLDL